MTDEQRKPLTALEWLRVTHADTLSGRRIEEAVAEARAAGDRLTADLRALAEELDRPAPALRGSYRQGYEIGQEAAAARLRAVVDAAEGAKA